VIERVQEQLRAAIARESLGWCLLFWVVTYAAVFGIGFEDESKSKSEKVTVKLRGKLPAALETNEQELGVFVAGNIEVLGQWRPDGLRLTPIDATNLQGEFEAEVDMEVEFKITRGSWTAVEKGANGGDIPNRKIKVISSSDGSPQKVEIVVENWSKSETRKKTITGTLDRYSEFTSKHLSEKRQITVWLPPGYGTTSTELAVLYLQDGQNLFDESTAIFGVEWGVDETLTRLIETNKIPPLIVVGIWNTKARLQEYTFTADERVGSGGEGERYLKFLVEELKPFIDQNYRTLSGPKGTWIGGSSLGGLFSLYASAKRPDVFGGCFAWSPSLHWDSERLLDETENGTLTWTGTELWLSMGESEGATVESRHSNVARAERLLALIRDSQKADLLKGKFFAGELGFHQEKSWKFQFPVAVEEMFGDKNRK
jgi:predicted alpha/beta superfamily hydrolase